MRLTGRMEVITQAVSCRAEASRKNMLLSHGIPLCEEDSMKDMQLTTFLSVGQWTWRLADYRQEIVLSIPALMVELNRPYAGSLRNLFSLLSPSVSLTWRWEGEEEISTSQWPCERESATVNPVILQESSAWRFNGIPVCCSSRVTNPYFWTAATIQCLF
jgi:hypothetical protein